MRVFVTFSIIIFFWVSLISLPIIEFEALEYDLGKIQEEKGPHKIDFKYSNSGDEPLKIIKIVAG